MLISDHTIDQIAKGVLPLPTEHNKDLYGLVQSLEGEITIDSAEKREHDFIISIRGKYDNFVFERTYSLEGKLMNEISFDRRKRRYVPFIGMCTSAAAMLMANLFIIENNIVHPDEKPSLLGVGLSLVGYLMSFYFLIKANKTNKEIEKTLFKGFEKTRNKNYLQTQKVLSTINIYKINLDEAQEKYAKMKVLETSVRSTEFSNPYFAEAYDSELKLKTYLVGGNAIVDYKTHNDFVSGIPVRID